MSFSHWKSNLGANELLFGQGLSAVLILACIAGLFYCLKRARLIEDTPTSRIRSAAQGYVELVGPVIGGEDQTLTAPLSGTPCVWYRYKVERHRDAEKNSHWETVRQGTSREWFQINDATDTCLIDPEGAEILTEHQRTWYGDSERPTRGATSPLLAMRPGDKRYRYSEAFIYPHDVIFALGEFRTVGGGRQLPSARQLAGDVIREWKRDYSALLNQYDSDGNGDIDMQEWQQVLTAAEKEAQQRRGHMAATPAMNVLHKPPAKGYPYIISNHSQKALTKRYRAISIATLVGAIGGGGFFVALLT